MNSPIKNQMNTVFVHVSHLKESVQWYSQLLGQNVDLTEVSNPVYNIEVNHYTSLTLDAGPTGIEKDIKNIKFPLFNFHTDDIHQSYAYVKKLGYQIMSDIIKFDNFSYFNISDPDDNLIMICTA